MSHTTLTNSGAVSFGFGTISSISVQDGTGVTYVYTLPTETRLDSSGKKVSRKRVGPKLYFSYVKSKLTKVQTKQLKSRLQKLRKMVKDAEEVGQKALCEKFYKMLVVAVRESEAAACGYDIYVSRKDIDKFRYQVYEKDSSSVNPVHFTTLEEFPRPVPAKVQKTIKLIKAKGIFDQLWILYLDYTGEKIKSTKEKIREKDPVLFGTFSYDPDRLYFIADWVDEYCDLTLTKFVDALKKDDETFSLGKIEDVTPDYLERIKLEIKEREERMQNVNTSNFKEKMAQEYKAEIERLRSENLKLKEDERHRAEDKEVAIERALKDRANWREEARKEAEGIQENLIDPMPEKKPWYKRLFG